MTEQEQGQEKKKLIEDLEKVNMRLAILDMIEAKLLRMKNLAQRVLDEDIGDKEIQDINKQLQELGSQVKLLDRDSTELS